MIWLVECGKIIVLHVRHAFWCNCLTTSAKRRREIVLTTTQVLSSKSFILYMKITRAKQEKVHFAYFVRRGQLEIIAKYFTKRWVLFSRDVLFQAVVVAFKLRKTKNFVCNCYKFHTIVVLDVAWFNLDVTSNTTLDRFELITAWLWVL